MCFLLTMTHRDARKLQARSGSLLKRSIERRARPGIDLAGRAGPVSVCETAQSYTPTPMWEARRPAKGWSCSALFRLEEVNKAYRKLAVLLHPDKCVAPGSEDAFKAVVNARTSLLKNIK
ncbi:hypothetical protein JZ751_004805 [Albula glossodonta]|uniref:J domain-containing protein n=1 Tax=Albula glossodonta TaxID=121402 RepID=A0A8T2PCL2_9TELE|nr:hypothetical protein JZ751_004805 [Albula glossodonta]